MGDIGRHHQRFEVLPVPEPTLADILDRRADPRPTAEPVDTREPERGDGRPPRRR